MPELKARPDFVETAHRVVMEAIGQWPKTPPPSEQGEAAASEHTASPQETQTS